MRLITLIVLGGMFSACGTTSPKDANSDIAQLNHRVGNVEHEAAENGSNIVMNAAENALIDLRLQPLEALLSPYYGSPWPPADLKGEKGDKGDPGVNGQDGKPGQDGVDGKDGKPGYPRTKAGSMVSVPGTTAKVEGIVEVESYCPSTRDVAVAGSCRLLSAPEDCLTVHVMSSGTFDNDTSSTAGFSCMFSAFEEGTTCEVIAVADCIQLP